MADIIAVPDSSEFDVSIPTDTNLSAKTYYAVKLSSGLAVLAGAGEQAMGILQNAPNGSSDRAVAKIRVLGLSLAKAGGSITFGAFLKSDADGKLVVTTTDRDLVVGMALTTADSGDEFAMVVVPGNVSHA